MKMHASTGLYAKIEPEWKCKCFSFSASEQTSETKSHEVRMSKETNLSKLCIYAFVYFIPCAILYRSVVALGLMFSVID